MKKSIFLFFAAILCAMSVQGATAELKNGQYLYCTVNNSNWKTWSIMFNWYWNEGDWCCQDNGTKLATDIWYAQIPNDYTRAVQLIRCKTDFSEQWDWSKTVKASSRSNDNQNCVNITGSEWGNAAVSWTTYAPPMSSVTLADNGTSIVSGSGTQADPYLVYTESTIKVKATGTKSVEDPDAKVNYDFKQATTSKQNSTTATYQFAASATVGTTYTINVDGYTKVNTTSSTKKAATALYYKTVEPAEETHDVTLNCRYGETILQTSPITKVGVFTSTPVSVPEITGYDFVNWQLGDGVATTDALTANPINITTKADETDYTITANYEEDLTTDWVLKGSFVDDFATAYNFEKKSGESTGTVAYVSMNLAANTAYEFKVVKGGSNWYGNNNTDEEYWIKNTIENWTFEQHKDNCHMKSELAGSYTFKIDYSDANPKVSVYYPDAPVKAVKIAGTMTGWEDSPVAFTIDGTIATLSIELTQGYHQFKIIETVTVDATDKDNWYGNGGTMTRKNCTEWTFNSGDNNATIFADADGAYTFEWDITTNKLSVTNMPEFPDLSHQPATLYFKPSTNWKENNAKYAAYFCYGDIGTDDKWVEMTPENGIYKVSNSDKKYVIVIFVRLNPDGEISWESQWNQTDNLIIPNTPNNLNTCFAFWKNSWEDVSGLWVAPTPLTDANWSDFVTAYAGETINAVIERSFKSGQYHTLCLPFDIPTNWLGEGTQAYQLTSIVVNNTGDKLSLNATKWETIVAGQPYIIVPVKGSEYEHVIINGVTVKNVSAGTNVASGDGYKATLKAVTATDGTQTNGSTEYYVGANDGKLYNTQTNKLGLRAIIELTTIGGQPLPPKVRAQVTTGENVETGVDNIVTTDTPVKAIENGQLIIIRDGVKYNVQGQKL